MDRGGIKAEMQFAINEEEKALQRFNTQPFNSFKVAAIVGEKSEVVSECGGADEKIAIPDHQASSSQPATFFAKDFAGFLIHTEEHQFRAQEALQRGFALNRITGIINPFVEFCEGDDGEGKTVKCTFLKASCDAFDVVQMVN